VINGLFRRRRLCTLFLGILIGLVIRRSGHNRTHIHDTPSANPVLESANQVQRLGSGPFEPSRRTKLPIATLVVLILAAIAGIFRAHLESLVVAIWIVAILLAGLGLAIWRLGRQEQGALAALGSALLSAAVVSFAVFGFQIITDTERTAAEDRQALQLALSSQDRLNHIDLRGRDLSNFYLLSKSLVAADLEHANLESTNLVCSDLTRVRSNGASFRGADLTNVIAKDGLFDEVDFADSDLFNTNFQGAFLWHAKFGESTHFSYTDLRGADLDGANFGRAAIGGTDEGDYEGPADLRGASLIGADLTQAHLEGALLQGALADNTTKWPTGFDPAKAGVVVEGNLGEPSANPPQAQRYDRPSRDC
jgi:uncharacterized protein YjbI with pentapeptide repeats